MAPGQRYSGKWTFGLERVWSLSCDFAGLVSVAINWA